MTFKKGNTFFKGRKHSTEAKRKISESQKGSNNSCWKGGRIISLGYISILNPDHPFCDINGRINEERLIMEFYLGRFLIKDEVVHHKNGNRSDNRIENLQVMTRKEHRRFHMLGKKYALGNKLTTEQRRKISEAGRNRFFSEETRLKLSIANKGKIMTDISRKKMSESHIGKKDSEQTRRNKSISAKKAWERRKGIVSGSR